MFASRGDEYWLRVELENKKRVVKEMGYRLVLNKKSKLVYKFLKTAEGFTHLVLEINFRPLIKIISYIVHLPILCC